MKTAVEWYAKRAMQLEIEKLRGEISTEKMLNELFEVAAKAIEIEETQRKWFFDNGFYYGRHTYKEKADCYNYFKDKENESK